MNISRSSVLTIALAAGSAILPSCSRPQTANRDEPAARQAGRDAYHAAQDVKKGAKEAAREIRHAGKEFRQGWEEGRRQDPAPRNPPRK